MSQPAMWRLLRAESAAAFAAICIAYNQLGLSWGLAALLFLLPDIGMLGYLRGPVIGARCYNALHTLILPALLIAASLLAGWHMALEIGLIWAGHIEFDRMLGYGLKLPTAFGDTHLGRVGRQAA